MATFRTDPEQNCTGFVRELLQIGVCSLLVPAEDTKAPKRKLGLSIDFTWVFMVLPERIELSTSPLPRECSTPLHLAVQTQN
jgi:hypothetical protein